MKIKREEYLSIIEAMAECVVVFFFTYAITFLCLLAFDSDVKTLLFDNGTKLQPTQELVAQGKVVDALAVTTITYCLSTVLKNLFGAKWKLPITIFSVGVCIVYTLIYVATINKVLSYMTCWWSTFIAIFFAWASEMEALIRTIQIDAEARLFHKFSA